MQRPGKYAVTIWIVFTIAICAMITAQGFTHTVLHDYFSGTARWLGGRDLYAGGWGFIYFPQAAVVLIPFYYLPFSGAELSWRLISLGLLGYSLWQLAKAVDSTAAGRAFLIFTLFCLPLAYSSARNGQFNLVMVAMMLFATTALIRSRCWLAALLLVIGLALKPTIIVLLLLTWVLYKRLWWRVPVWLVVILLLPFLFQHSNYVFNQYLNVQEMLNATAKLGSTTAANWAQLFGLLSQVGLYLSRYWQTLIRVIFAIATFGMGLWLRRNYRAEVVPVLLYSLAACYLMLFNPRTENTDYVIMAPALGYFANLYYQRRKFGRVVVMALLGLGMAGSYYFSGLILPHHTKIWVGPLMTVIFAVIIVVQLLMRSNYERTSETTTTA